MSICVSISYLSIYLRVKGKTLREDREWGEKQRGTKGEEREEVRRKRRTVKAKGKAGQLGLEQRGSRLESQLFHFQWMPNQ